MAAGRCSEVFGPHDDRPHVSVQKCTQRIPLFERWAEPRLGTAELALALPVYAGTSGMLIARASGPGLPPLGPASCSSLCTQEL